MDAAEERADSLALSATILQRITEVRRAEAELDRLAERIRALPSSTQLDAEESERRLELLRLVNLSYVPNEIGGRRSDRAVIDIGDLLFPWSVINLPFMYEGINESPSVSGTSGGIETAGLYAGGLAYAGLLEDDNVSPPLTEKWWIHNWYNSVIFPAAPFNGRLFYRFTVDSECNIYRAPVFSGSVREFVTVGWTSDAAASDPPTDWTTWQSVGLPVDQTLPSNTLNLGGSIPVLGSIPVEEGKNAALGFIYGTIVSLASGYLQFLWGNFGTRLTLPPATPVGYQAYDKIEYRFEPAWWLSAIDERLQLANSGQGRH